MQAGIGIEFFNLNSWSSLSSTHQSAPISTHNLLSTDHHPSITQSKIQDNHDPSSDTEDESKPPIEYSDGPVHADGVPKSDTKLMAKNYRTREFSEKLFDLLRTELGLAGWKDLLDQHKSSITISKVSGSLTNAVFFVSCPLNSASDHSQSVDSSLSSSSSPPPPPPTVLLRIYGPSSGTLISRQEELHLLHTLSAKYGIGPLLLGTFHNGRVEQFFQSRPLTKEEVRDPQISTWIARKMSELHSVELSVVINPGQDLKGHSPSNYRTSSLSSESKWIPYSTYSPLLAASTSPFSTPQLRSINSNSSRDGQQPHSLTAGSKFVRTGVWNNIIRWQHEATKVFADITKAFEKLEVQSDSDSSSLKFEGQDILDLFKSSPSPLSSPHALLQFVKIVDLPRFILEMKSYRLWILNHEKANGRSPRVFCHNDTQCGNLLLRLDNDPLLNEQPQDQIMVIDFEYASANPRGFDIANHFHEWCADYHHPTSSHSMTSHGNYPSYQERKTFYQAYLALAHQHDQAYLRKGSINSASKFKPVKDCEITEFDLDDPAAQPSAINETVSSQQDELTAGTEKEDEDSSIAKLEEDVNRWSPASHAMWALWGLVQARDDLKVQLDRWLALQSSQEALDGLNGIEEVEFDYFSYSAERIILFRRLLSDLKIPIIKS